MKVTVSPSDPADESKIIDLRQLGALIDPGQAAPTPVRASQSAVALPSFGATQLNRPAPRPLVPSLPTAPIAPPVPAPAVAAPRRGRSTSILMGAIGLLTAAVVGLAYYVVIETPTQTIVRETIVAAPAVAATELTKDDAPEAEAVAPAPNREELVAAATPPEETPSDDNAALPRDASKRDKPRGTRRRGRDTRKTPRATSTPPVTKTRETTPPKTRAPKTDSHIPAECVIDPTGCGLGGTTGRDRGKPGPTKKPEAELPKKLSPAAVRSGIASVKAEAKACRSKYGGTAGEKVAVKLTISGATGRVTKAAPVAPHAGTPLGGCVAAALKRAQFGHFTATVQGVQYGVRM
ncbi:MAG: hypothetical protein AAF721_07925 [Myxococcota bacterium]